MKLFLIFQRHKKLTKSPGRHMCYKQYLQNPMKMLGPKELAQNYILELYIGQMGNRGELQERYNKNLTLIFHVAILLPSPTLLKPYSVQ